MLFGPAWNSKVFTLPRPLNQTETRFICNMIDDLQSPVVSKDNP